MTQERGLGLVTATAGVRIGVWIWVSTTITWFRVYGSRFRVRAASVITRVGASGVLAGSYGTVSVDGGLGAVLSHDEDRGDSICFTD